MQSQTLSLSLIVGASVSLVLMLAFNGLSGSGAAPSIFVGSVSETSHLYETSITPAGNTKFQEKTCKNEIINRFSLLSFSNHLFATNSGPDANRCQKDEL